MSMSIVEKTLPSVLVFGSQTTLPSDQIASQLRAFILLDRRLYPFLTAIRQLTDFWSRLVAFDARLEQIPGLEGLHVLQSWIERGEPLSSIDIPTNVLATPLTVIVHLIQYLHYLDSNYDVGATHHALLVSLQAGGIQGCCTGLLSAVAVACSNSEEDVVQYACKALRLAVCVGAYVDLDKVTSVPPKATTCLVVRWKSGAGRSIVDETLQSYKEVKSELKSRLSCLEKLIIIQGIHITDIGQQHGHCDMSHKPKGLIDTSSSPKWTDHQANQLKGEIPFSCPQHFPYQID